MKGMRRFSLPLVAAFVFFTSTLPAYAAANLPLLDPNFSIVPSQCTGCPCNYFGLLQLIQNLMNAGIALGLIAFSLALAYAGATIMLNPTSPEMRSTARSMLLNIAVGLVILLSAWLVVDFIMKLIYDPEATLSGGESFGPWNEILSSKDQKWCIDESVAKPIGGIGGGIAGWVNGGTSGGGGVTGTPGTVGKTRGLCDDRNTACSITALKAYGLTDKQATAMSCIAVTESGGNPQTQKSKSGACGTFQITTKPGNWSNAQYHSGACSSSTSCNNAACNLQTAVLMFKDQGYQPWTGKNPNGEYWNPNAVACVKQYDT